MGRKTTVRYSVCIYGRMRDEDRIGSLDVTQAFSDRRKAERFAEAISHQIPPGNGRNGCALAWVIVYAMQDPSQGTYQHAPGHAYLCFDHGGVVVKRHDIMRGCYGFTGPDLYDAKQRDRVPVAPTHPNAWNEGK